MTEISRCAEDFVCDWLESRGWSILQRNFRTRRSEIDIIASTEGTIAFVEVKYAGDGSKTVALEKIDPAKRSRIVHGASVYLSSNPPSGQVRFDVAIVRGTPDRMRMGQYVSDAFRPGLV